MATSQFHGKTSVIMVKVPKAVSKTAASAFTLRDEGFVGATETGWKRAKQLHETGSISIEDVRFMRNWYARHVFTSYPGYKAWVDNKRPPWYKKRAILSWITWGGDAGLKWVNSKSVRTMLNKHFDKEYEIISRNLS